MAEPDWVAEALGALDRGDPPPSSFGTFDDEGFSLVLQGSTPPEEATRPPVGRYFAMLART